MKLAEAYVDITTRTRRFMAGLASVRVKLTASMRRMAAIAKRGAIIIGAALAAAFTAAIWAATKFEEQLAMISTMLTKKTMPAMREFAKGMRRLAVAFGQSTQTLAKGLYDILSASISASKAMAVLETSARAAIAGMTDTAIAVDVITTVINSYKMSAKDAEKVSDALFATVKAGKLTFQELAQYLGMVAAPAAAAGEKLEELLAALATLTRAGVKPRIAVTYLRQALMAFSKSAPDAHKAAKEFGLALNTTTLQTIGLVGVLKKLEHASAEQLAMIFSSNEAYNAMITLRGDMIGLERDLAAQYKASGSTLEAYNKMSNTFAFQLKRVKEAVLGLGRAFGKPLLEPLKAIAKWFIDNEKTLRVWAEKAAVHVLYFAGVLTNFWKHTDFKGKWKSMLDSIIIMLKAFVKAAIVLAVAAGKGIAVGIKKGTKIGQWLESREVRQETEKRYRVVTGMKPRGIGDMPITEEFAEFPKIWKTMREAIEKERTGQATDPIIAQAFAGLKDITVKAAEDLEAAMEKPLNAAGKLAKENLDAWRKTRLAMIDFEAATEDAANAAEDEADARGKIFRELQRPEKEKEKEKPQVMFRGLLEHWKGLQLAALSAPKVKTEAEKTQDRQLLLQKRQYQAQQAIQNTLEIIRGSPSGATLARG